MEYQSSSTPTRRVQRPSTYLQMPRGHWAMEHTSTGHGTVVTSSETSLALDSVAGIVCHHCTWGHLLQGQRITVHCNNMAIVQSWSNQSARHPGILHLLRKLFFITAKHSFIVRLVHLPGKLNRIADALSRNQLSLFSALAPKANPQLTPVPPELAELSVTRWRSFSTEHWPHPLRRGLRGIMISAAPTTGNHSRVQLEPWHYS